MSPKKRGWSGEVGIGWSKQNSEFSINGLNVEKLKKIRKFRKSNYFKDFHPIFIDFTIFKHKHLQTHTKKMNY